MWNIFSYELHLFWDSFWWFCLQISSDTKYFFLSCPRHCDQELIVVIVYYFPIWNKKKKDTTLLLVELIAVTWVPCILRHPILIEKRLSFLDSETVWCWSTNLVYLLTWHSEGFNVGKLIFLHEEKGRLTSKVGL